METKLTIEEIRELKGGCQCEFVKEDVLNNNQNFGCRCEYNNHSAIENRNGVQACTCSCF